MLTPVPVIIAYMLRALWQSCAFAQEADSTLPGWLVTSQTLESKIADTTLRLKLGYEYKCA